MLFIIYLLFFSLFSCSQVNSSGAAARDNRLKVGMRILEVPLEYFFVIEGKNVTRVTDARMVPRNHHS